MSARRVRRPAASWRPRYELRLFVTGTTPASVRAIGNLRRICERYLPGRYVLEVVDMYQQPALARTAQIVAAPTLVKVSPGPLRKLVGDMSNEARVLVGLSLPA